MLLPRWQPSEKEMAEWGSSGPATGAHLAALGIPLADIRDKHRREPNLLLHSLGDYESNSHKMNALAENLCDRDNM